jgi:hypothetical protein
VAKYTAPARAEGIVPGGPPITEAEWREELRRWAPKLYDTKLVRPTWGEVAAHHDPIGELLGQVPLTVAHQRLVDDVGLAVSYASLRRYVLAHLGEVRRSQVVVWRPPVRAGRRSPGQLRLPRHLGRAAPWPAPLSTRGGDRFRQDSPNSCSTPCRRAGQGVN